MKLIKHLPKQYKIKNITLNENGTYDEGYISIGENELMEAANSLPSDIQSLYENKVKQM